MWNKDQLLFLNCKKKILITVGRSVCGTTPSFPTSHAFAVAKSTCEGNLGHSCPRTGFRSEVKGELGIKMGCSTGMDNIR